MTQSEGTAAGCMKLGLLHESSHSTEFSKYLCNSFRGAVVMRVTI